MRKSFELIRDNSKIKAFCFLIIVKQLSFFVFFRAKSFADTAVFLKATCAELEKSRTRVMLKKFVCSVFISFFAPKAGL